MLVLNMIEIIPPLEKYKYDTWRILLVKCYIDNFVRLWSCIWNVNSVHSRATTLQYRTLPSSQGGLRPRHVSNGSRPRLPAREGSSVVTCPVALDPTSPMGGLQHFHVSHRSGPHLSAREGSGVAMCPTALNPVFPLGRAPMPPHAPRLQTLPLR
jgi:hypothetical protein